MKVSVPALDKLDVFWLIDNLPKNAYVQDLTFQALRMWEEDDHVQWKGPFGIRKLKPNMQIDTQTVRLTTPVLRQVGKRGEVVTKEDFKKWLREADRIALAHEDVPLTERLYIKNVVLMEIPKDDWHDGPYQPAVGMPCDENGGECTGDPLYHGVEFYFTVFEGTYKVLGPGKPQDGHNLKPMHMIGAVRCKTVHYRNNHKKNQNPYEVLQEFDAKQVAGWGPEAVKTVTPELFGNIIIIRECEGDMKPKMSFHTKFCRKIRKSAG